MSRTTLVESPYTPELLEIMRQVIASYRQRHGNGIDCRRLAAELLDKGVGLVDASRRTFLVDLNVYQGAQVRLRQAEARIAELEAELVRVTGLARDFTTTEADICE